MMRVILCFVKLKIYNCYVKVIFGSRYSSFQAEKNIKISFVTYHFVFRFI